MQFKFFSPIISCLSQGNFGSGATISGVVFMMGATPWVNIGFNSNDIGIGFVSDEYSHGQGIGLQVMDGSQVVVECRDGTWPLNGLRSSFAMWKVWLQMLWRSAFMIS